MQKENEKNMSIVPFGSQGLVRLGTSISITEKILKERDSLIKSEIKFDWGFVFKFKSFFNQLFSTFYDFDENELDKYFGKLEIGSPHLTDRFYTIQDTIFGLLYNKKIKWTEFLKLKYYRRPELLRVTENADVYSFQIDFESLPLEILDEMESIKGFIELRILDGYGYSEEENYYDQLNDDLKNLEKYYNNILSKSHFTGEEILNIIVKSENDYIFNSNFYFQVISKLNFDMEDFSIDEFYKNY